MKIDIDSDAEGWPVDIVINGMESLRMGLVDAIKREWEVAGALRAKVSEKNERNVIIRNYQVSVTNQSHYYQMFGNKSVLAVASVT